MNIGQINPLYNNNLLNQITSELQKEKEDIEELSVILDILVKSFQYSGKSDIFTAVKLFLKLKDIDPNYRKVFFVLINVAINDSHGRSFITLDCDKIYSFANSKEIQTLNLSYKNILQSRGQDDDFTPKEFENFIIKCANIVNEIISSIITKPNNKLLIKKIDVMNVGEDW